MFRVDSKKPTNCNRGGIFISITFRVGPPETDHAKGAETKAVTYCGYSATQHRMRAAKHHFLTRREGRKQRVVALGHHPGLPIEQGTEGARTASTSSDRESRSEASKRQVFQLEASLLQFLLTHCCIRIYSFTE